MKFRFLTGKYFLFHTPLLIFILIFQIKAQSIQNIKVEQHIDTVVVKYDLMSERNDDVFNVRLLVSDNNGATFDIIPKKKVWGDIGYGLTPSVNKTIFWLPLKDSLELIGDNYIFKIETTLMGATPKIEFVTIKGGKFRMGSNAPEAKSDERPVHTVYLNDFKMSINEVTIYQFLTFLNAYGKNEVKDGEYKGEKLFYPNQKGIDYFKSTFNTKIWKTKKEYEFYPMVGVTWYGANEFCKYYGYRLPTEAEWEYAAREGGKKVRFGNGTNIADPSEINFNSSSELNKKYSISGENRKSQVRVCTFPPNKLKLFEMSGNVWEWCQDWYKSNYYFHSKKYVPTGPWFGRYKVIRGGSWYNSADDIRTTDRSFFPPYKSNGDIGFRVVQEITKK